MKKVIFTSIFVSLLSFSVFYCSDLLGITPYIASAQGNSESDDTLDSSGSDDTLGNSSADDTVSNRIHNPAGEIGTIDEFLVKILEWVRKVALMIVLPLALIYGGFLFIKAQGKPEELQKAKSTFLYTVLGAAVIIGAELLVKIISDTLRSL